MWWRYWARLTFTCHCFFSLHYFNVHFILWKICSVECLWTCYCLMILALWHPINLFLGRWSGGFLQPSTYIFLHAMNFLSRIVVLICRILSVPPRVVAQSLHCPTSGGWNFENVSGRWDLLSLSFRVQEDLTRHPKNYWRIRGRVCLLHFPYIRSAYMFIAGVCI